MRTSLLVQLSAALMLSTIAASGDGGVLATPIDSNSNKASVATVPSAGANSWSSVVSAAATAPQVTGQLEHAFTESDLMRHVRDRLTDSLSRERVVALRSSVDDMLLRPTKDSVAHYDALISHIADSLREDFTRFGDRLRTVLDNKEMQMRGNEKRFVSSMLDAFRDLVEHFRQLPRELPPPVTAATVDATALPQQRALQARSLRSSSSSSNVNATTPETFNHAPPVVDTPTSSAVNPPASNAMAVDGPFAEFGLLLGQLLESAVTGRQFESSKVTLLRIARSMVLIAELHDTVHKGPGHSTLDDALATLKKAADAALASMLETEPKKSATETGKPIDPVDGRSGSKLAESPSLSALELESASADDGKDAVVVAM